VRSRDALGVAARHSAAVRTRYASAEAFMTTPVELSGDRCDVTTSSRSAGGGLRVVWSPRRQAKKVFGSRRGAHSTRRGGSGAAFTPRRAAETTPGGPRRSAPTVEMVASRLAAVRAAGRLGLGPRARGEATKVIQPARVARLRLRGSATWLAGDRAANFAGAGPNDVSRRVFFLQSPTRDPTVTLFLAAASFFCRVTATPMSALQERCG